MNTKICSKCREEKNVLEFYACKTWYQAQCKKCQGSRASKVFHAEKPTGTKKQCRCCGNVKSCDEFSFSKALSDGLQSYCNSCKDGKTTLAKFGIKQSEFDSILKNQNYVCCICFQPEKAKTKAGILKRLCIDHCHTSGVIRGVICHSCNVIIGIYENSAHKYQMPEIEKYLRDPPIPKTLGSRIKTERKDRL
jgi:Recombination endonuclease VII